MKKYIVDADLEGERLDKTLTKLDTQISRAMVQKLIDDGKVLINGNPREELIQSKKRRYRYTRGYRDKRNKTYSTRN